MEILLLEMEPIARDILGKTSGLRGEVTVKSTRGVEVKFVLSHETITTIVECIERDYEDEVKRLV